MKLIALPFVLALFFSMTVFAQQQTPAYTTSVSFACNQEVCNGVPLDQGGMWQFIEANRAFSLANVVNGKTVFYIFGNPGNPSTYDPPCSYTPGSCANSTPGGMSNIVDNIPEPPNENLGVGGPGTITFNFQAVTCNQPCSQKTYFGHSVVQGHEVRHCYIHGCWDQMIVDEAKIYIDSVQ